MKNLFKIALLCASVSLWFNSAFASNVIFNMQQIVGYPSNPQITISLPDDAAFLVGTNIVYGFATIQCTNGMATVSNLASLVYDLDIQGINRRFRMPVPNDTNTYSAFNLITVGLQLESQGQFFAAGSNVTLTTNYTLGLATITVNAVLTNYISSTNGFGSDTTISNANLVGVTSIDDGAITTDGSGDISTSGSITDGSENVTGTVQAGSVNANNTLSGGSLIVSGAIQSDHNKIASDSFGDLRSLSLATGNLTNTNTITTGNLTVTGTASIPGVQPTNSTLTYLGLYPTNSLAYTIQLNALSNALPAANLVGLVPTNSGGTGNAIGYSQGVSNGITGINTLNWTNALGISPVMVVGLSQLQHTNVGGNVYINVLSSDNTRGSGSGFQFLILTTNYVAVNGIPQIWSTNINPYTGLAETNYVLNANNAPQLNVVHSGSNVNIGAGAFEMWGANNAVMLATFLSGEQELAEIYITNGFTYFLQAQTTNYDGSKDGFAKYLIAIDHNHSGVTFSNLSSFGVSAGNFSINQNGYVTALATGAATYMPSGAATFTNLSLQQHSGYGQSDLLSYISFNNAQYNAGGGLFSYYLGVRNNSAQSMYFGNSSTPIYQFDSVNGIQVLASLPLTVNYLLVTNQPTFAHTNSAPVNTTTPKLWIDVTNNGASYRMPLYQ